jgi:branched-chain amino acid transport system substrate-binding protein
MHINDTFETAIKVGIGAVMPKFNLPYTLVDTIAYDPAARDLSVEVAKAKATGADALLMVSRLNDAILLTRELVKQRWSPMAILSMGPGWYEDQYLKTLGKLSDGPLSFVPWYDPNKPLSKKLEDALAKAHPGVNLNTIMSIRSGVTRRCRCVQTGWLGVRTLADAHRAVISQQCEPGPRIQ